MLPLTYEESNFFNDRAYGDGNVGDGEGGGSDRRRVRPEYRGSENDGVPPQYPVGLGCSHVCAVRTFAGSNIDKSDR